MTAAADDDQTERLGGGAIINDLLASFLSLPRAEAKNCSFHADNEKIRQIC